MEERTALLSLASHRLRGEGDHEVVEGNASTRTILKPFSTKLLRGDRLG